MNTTQEDFIKRAVYTECIKAGIPEQASSDQSEAARLMYKRGQFTGKPLDLIKAQVQTAKRINKKQRVKK